MDSKADIKIKQEIVDSNENYLSFDVDVKVEENDTPDDWSMLDALETYPICQVVNYIELKQENPHTCILCGEYFFNSYSLLKHNLIHLNVPLIQRKIFMCDHCSYYSKKKNELLNHIHSIHATVQNNSKIPITKRNHTCMICMKTFEYKHWWGHMSGVHGQLEIKCNICNMQFKCTSYLRRHHKRRHLLLYKPKGMNYEEVKCPKCPTILCSKYALTTHLRNCHSNERFECHLCKSSLKCRSYYLTHMKRVHYNDGLVHECDMCNKFFKSPRYLNIHKKNSHFKEMNKGETVKKTSKKNKLHKEQVKEEMKIEVVIED